jgi:hypothetical protein
MTRDEFEFWMRSTKCAETSNKANCVAARTEELLSGQKVREVVVKILTIIEGLRNMCYGFGFSIR